MTASLVIQFAEVYISANRTVRPLTIEERRQLWRRIRDVKKVYPYAKYVAATIIETYEYMQTSPRRSKSPTSSGREGTQGRHGT